MVNYETSETIAAAVYMPKETDRPALTKLVAELKADEVSVAGILRESHVKPGESKRTIDSVDITLPASGFLLRNLCPVKTSVA